MARKDFLKKDDDLILEKLNREPLPPLEPIGEAKPQKLGWFYNWLFGVIKLVLGICLLPLVYSFTKAFLKELEMIPLEYQQIFWAGLISFLLVFHFIWEPAAVYRKGHQLLEIIFGFVKPLVKVAPYLLPIYAVVLALGYAALTLVNPSKDYNDIFIFLLGFFVTLHLVFSARTIRAKKGDFLKGNYIFGFSFVYLINVCLVALVLNLVFANYSLVNFFNEAFHGAQEIFSAVLTQLFVPYK